MNKQVLENQKLTIQEEWDISDATMHNLYLLAKQLLDEKRFKESDAVFTVLSYLNPKVPEYTLGASIALYAMGDYEAAAELLQLTKILQPNHPAPFVYSALCHQKLNNAQKYAEDRARVDELLAQSDQARKDWEPYLKLFASKREV